MEVVVGVGVVVEVVVDVVVEALVVDVVVEVVVDVVVEVVVDVVVEVVVGVVVEVVVVVVVVDVVNGEVVLGGKTVIHPVAKVTHNAIKIKELNLILNIMLKQNFPINTFDSRLIMKH